MKPGSRVICVDDVFHPVVRQFFENVPKKGQIYTVKDLVPNRFPPDEMNITLVGVENPKYWFPCKNGKILKDHSFTRGRFREVEDPDPTNWETPKLDMFEMGFN